MWSFSAANCVRARSRPAAQSAPEDICVEGFGRPRAFHVENARSASLPHWATDQWSHLRVGSPPVLVDARFAPWLRPARTGVPSVATRPLSNARMRIDSLRLMHECSWALNSHTRIRAESADEYHFPRRHSREGGNPAIFAMRRWV